MRGLSWPVLAGLAVLVCAVVSGVLLGGLPIVLALLGLGLLLLEVIGRLDR